MCSPGRGGGPATSGAVRLKRGAGAGCGRAPRPPPRGGRPRRRGAPAAGATLPRPAPTRGASTAPFTNGGLVSAAAAAADVDRHTEVLAEAIADLS